MPSPDAARRRGRPRVDRLETLERVACYLADNPAASASQIAAELRIRKQDAFRIVRAVRDLARRFPNAERAA